MSLIGCYIVTHLPSGKFYVGSSSDLGKRRKFHESTWRTGKTNHTRLLEAFRITNRHEDMDWQFYLTETREEAFALEQALLDEHWGNPDLLNGTKNARAPIAGIEFTDDIIKKHRESMRKYMETPGFHEFRSAVSKRTWEKHPELREKIGGANHRLSKPLMADGVRYESAGQAAEALGLYDSKSVCYRIRSPGFPGYYYLDDRPVNITNQVF